MSKIEAAASLFGSSDSGSDFFTATEGSDSRKESPANASSSYGTSAPSNDDPSSLFENTVDSSDAAFLFSGDGPQNEAYVYGNAPLAASNVTAVGQEDYNNGFDWTPAGDSSANQYDYPQSEWDVQGTQQDTQGQYEQVQNQCTLFRPSLKVKAYISRPDGFHQTSATSSNHTSTPWSYGANGKYDTEEKSTTVTGPPEQSTYSPVLAPQSNDPYRPTPAIQQHESSYTTAQGNSSYDPYKPTNLPTSHTSSQPTPYSAQQQGSAYSGSAGTSNAYDPYKPTQSTWNQPAVASTAPQSQPAYASSQGIHIHKTLQSWTSY